MCVFLCKGEIGELNDDTFWESIKPIVINFSTLDVSLSLLQSHSLFECAFLTFTPIVVIRKETVS